MATSTVVAFWKSIAGFAERAGRRLLVELERKTLIRVAGTPPFAYVHDHVADYLTAGRAQLQKVLLDYYRKQCVDGWASGPDDGYFHRHLIDHLAARADGKKELADLLSASTPDGRNAWFEASDRTSNFDAYRLQLKRLINDQSADLPEVMTHAMRIASVNALDVPLSLAAALVRFGRWTIRQAIRYTQQSPDPKLRAVRLAGLLDQATDEFRGQLIEDALAVIASMDEFPSGLEPLLDALATEGRTAEALALARRAAHGDPKVGALATVARHLAGLDHEVVVNEAIEVCATTSDLFRAAAIELALPLLDRDGLRKLDAAAIEPLQNPVARGSCEVPFVMRLIALKELDAAWTRARNISDEVSRANAIAACVAHLPAAKRKGAVKKVLQTITKVNPKAELDNIYESFSHLPRVLSDLLPLVMEDQPLLLEPLKNIASYLNETQLSKAVKLVQFSDDLLFAAEGAATLAPFLSPAVSEALIKQMVERTTAEQDENRRMKAFAVLLTAMQNDVHEEIFQQAFADIRRLEKSQLSALKNLAPALRGEEIDAALAMIGEADAISERLECVEALVPAATPPQLLAARSVVTKISDEREALLAAAALTPNLDSDVRGKLLDRALLQSDYIRARLIALLVPQVDDQQVDKALQAAEQIEDPTSIAEVALPALARRAPDAQQRKAILEHAIDIAARMTDPERRVWALEAMIDQFDPALRDHAFARFTEEAAAMDDEWRAFGEGIFIAVIAGGMPEPKRGELLDQALALVPQLEESNLRRDVLSRLAPHLDLQRWQIVTEIVEAEKDPYEQAIMAGFLVGYAPKQLWPRFVEAALSRIEEIAAGDYGFIDDATEAAGARVLAYSAQPMLGLDVAARYKDEGWKRAALLEFVKATPVDALDPVLVQINSLSAPRDRASLKLAVAQRLQNAPRETLIAETLEDALDGPADLLHDDLLPDLSRALCELPVDRLRDLWRENAPRLSERARPQTLSLVHGLAPVLVRLELGDPTVRALFDAERWWP